MLYGTASPHVVWHSPIPCCNISCAVTRCIYIWELNADLFWNAVVKFGRSLGEGYRSKLKVFEGASLRRLLEKHPLNRSDRVVSTSSLLLIQNLCGIADLISTHIYALRLSKFCGIAFKCIFSFTKLAVCSRLQSLNWKESAHRSECSNRLFSGIFPFGILCQ